MPVTQDRLQDLRGEEAETQYAREVGAGGIASLCGGGSYTIVNSAVINNTARAGGGIVYVNGQQTIVNSTLSGNQATQPDSIGGAIMSFADDLHITNSTIARNTCAPQELDPCGS